MAVLSILYGIHANAVKLKLRRYGEVDETVIKLCALGISQ